ncbi:hypothetical protein COV18_02815 [Candidatus Woesearchaeota archaeon CG10_big_fil_rev_8_21_14_0_10_37_12]|nr:MAG: hypothetical protein COV18_02815 [Candidatus Woesearchaeota archaeon CG10_big_fil_rev_8_21_14_0_10_37_12]
MNIEPLRELGLTEGEIRVYIALIGLGETTTGPLVDQSGVSVSKVYVILDRLAKKGLVSHVLRKKTKHFKAADPDRLLVYLNEKQHKLREQEAGLKHLIPQLQLKHDTALTEETAQVYDGMRGVQTAREQALKRLKKGDQMWLVGIARTPYENLISYFADYHKRRISKGILCNYLYNDYSRKPFGEKSATYPLSRVRYMPKGIVTHTWFEIYGDNVVIGLRKGKTFSVVIKNKEVANSFVEYAKLLWSLGKP